VVEETLETGASVARVALKYGVNANQVFQWRRLYRDGKLGVSPEGAMKLLPVSVADDEEPLRSEPTEVVSSSSGAIHIELPGEVRISLEGIVDPAVVRVVLMSLRR
jgi:transposase